MMPSLKENEVRTRVLKGGFQTNLPCNVLANQ